MATQTKGEVGPVFPEGERRQELETKQTRMQQFLAEQGLDALLVSRHENIAWVTAGTVEMRVAIPYEAAAGNLLFTRSGQRYYLATNNEAPRLAQEEFAGLDYEPVISPWHANDVAGAVRKIVGKGKVAGDMASADWPAVSLQPLRLALCDGEIERYRWLCARTAKATTDVLLALRPGTSEATMQASIAEPLLAQNILPTVFLMGTDERIRNYRHAVPRCGVLRNYGMLNLCARRWGLAVSITRFVYFGAMPAELQEKFAAVAQVNARLLHATRAGATSDALFHVAQQAYAELGYPGEEQFHHQGGATGYGEREWIALPGGKDVVHDHQAFAWNPSLQGSKAEDTVVLRNGAIEVMTATPRLPVVETQIGGATYTAAGVLPA